MNKVRRRSVLLGLGLAALASGCALTPPVQNSGALAKDGVQVAVVGQRCQETVEPEWPEANLVETVVQVRLENSSAAPVTVHPAALRLRGADGRQVPSDGWAAPEPVSIPPGQGTTFTVGFTTRGGVSCTQPMQLDVESGVAVGSAPVRLGSVTFTPSRT